MPKRVRVLVPALALVVGGACQLAPARTIRVCADPNNLPFSNRAGEGFENRIAELLARDRHAALDYTWWAQRRGNVRSTLNAGTCDVLIGVPTAFALAETTKRYYRSTYVFVAKKYAGKLVRSFDDPRLRHSSGIAVDAGGAIYVIDAAQGGINVFFPDGTFFQTWHERFYR